MNNCFSIYAPVIIPTLCRYEHFKRCLDSLERCTGANNTEVYVGLDYPTSEKHVDGRKKISLYLEEKEKNNCFKKLYVFRHMSNLGVGNAKKGNIYFLYSQILKSGYDRYIFSEDDNEFSPNFLEYINKGLERYKDNPNILNICGYLITWNANYKECMGQYKYNAFPAKDYNAIGVGCWVSKQVDLKSMGLTKDNILHSSWLSFKAFKCGYSGAIRRFLQQLHKDSQIPDVCKRLYCAFNKKYCIFPTVSKVRNWGYDGTGLNSDNNPKWIDAVVLDKAMHFNYDDFEIKDYKEVKQLISQMYDKPPGTTNRRKKIIKRYFFYRVTGEKMEDMPEGVRVRSYMLRMFLKRNKLKRR